MPLPLFITLILPLLRRFISLTLLYAFHAMLFAIADIFAADIIDASLPLFRHIDAAFTLIIFAAAAITPRCFSYFRHYVDCAMLFSLRLLLLLLIFRRHAA